MADATKTKHNEQTDLPQISTQLAVKIIEHHYDIRKPGLLWGSPGCGKTSAVREAGHNIGQRLGVPFTVKEAYLSRMTPADVGGLPALDKENHKTTFYLPDLLTDLPTEHGILFFDELTTADPQTRSAVMNLILEGKLGEFTLPKGWFCMAAANPREWGGIYGDLGPAMNNRFTQYQVVANMSEWVNDWAPANNIHPMIPAFFRNIGGQHFDTNRENMAANPKLFPTPRSWAAVSNILKNVSDQKLQDTMIKGTVGFAAATAFLQFQKNCDDMYEIRTYLKATKNPDELRKIMPKKIGSLYVLACAMPLYVHDAGKGDDEKKEIREQNDQVYSLLTQMYFAKDKWKEDYDAGSNIREIAVVGWEITGRRALEVDRQPTAKNQDFRDYDKHRAAIVNAANKRG